MDDVLGDLSRVRLSLSRRVEDASCDATRCVSRRVGRLARRDVVERDAIGRRETRRAGRIVLGGGAGGDLRESERETSARMSCVCGEESVRPRWYLSVTDDVRVCVFRAR